MPSTIVIAPDGTEMKLGKPSPFVPRGRGEYFVTSKGRRGRETIRDIGEVCYKLFFRIRRGGTGRAVRRCTVFRTKFTTPWDSAGRLLVDRK